MTIEKRIYGPPGTGKTTKLSTYVIPELASRYGHEKIMVCSFTRAAAKEIATKKARFTTKFIEQGDTIPIPDSNIGTLHSICFRSLANPKIIEVEKKLIHMWNEENPELAITGQSAVSSSFDEVFVETDKGGAGYGDKLLSALNIKRNRLMVDQALWQADLKRFHMRWEKFKEEHGCFDFTDLIEVCIKDKLYAPNRPAAIVVDEAQDMTKLQLRLIRKWGDDMDEILLCGDDDQCIYNFAGASAEGFLDPPIDDKFKTILGQSYRVPRLVLERANSLISRVSQRQPKDYRPRTDENGDTVDGMVSECAATYGKPEAAVSWAADLATDGKTVAILASCSYMLEPAKRILRERGLPFHNPYRRTRGDWNPLYSPPSKNGSVGAIDIIKSFTDLGQDAPYWTVHDFVAWAQFVKVGDTGLIRSVGKKYIDHLKTMVETTPADPQLITIRKMLAKILSPAACERALARDLEWLVANLRSDRTNDKLDYALKVKRNFGMQAVFERPKILIGTIHSVKGGEASAVFLFPDISWQADTEMQNSQQGIDNACRVFYVGMTRAKEELILCNPNIKKNNRAPRMYVQM